MYKLLRSGTLFLIGGGIYLCVELLWRGYSHWSMFLLGGLCFLVIGQINEGLSWDMPLWKQGLAGAVVITAVEFLTGCVVNLWLGWQVWNYSDMPWNLLGQVCLPFSLLWIVAGMAAVVLDDYLRYWLFGEEKPHYRVF